MDTEHFSLRPFPGEEPATGLKIAGTIGRRGKTLSIDCTLAGTLSELAIPSPEEEPKRRGRLWEETCLELFLAKKGDERYWEFNFSPAGHWNVYRFASYREEMQEEAMFSSLPFRVGVEPEAIRFSADLGIGKILPADWTVEAAVSAVVRTLDGRTSHWALVHAGPRPDFHRRKGFTLTIPADPGPAFTS